MLLVSPKSKHIGGRRRRGAGSSSIRLLGGSPTKRDEGAGGRLTGHLSLPAFVTTSSRGVELGRRLLQNMQMHWRTFKPASQSSSCDPCEEPSGWCEKVSSEGLCRGCSWWKWGRSGNSSWWCPSTCSTSCSCLPSPSTSTPPLPPRRAWTRGCRRSTAGTSQWATLRTTYSSPQDTLSTTQQELSASGDGMKSRKVWLIIINTGKSF